MRFLAFCLATLAAATLLSRNTSLSRNNSSVPQSRPTLVPDAAPRRRVRFPVAFSVN